MFSTARSRILPLSQQKVIAPLVEKLRRDGEEKGERKKERKRGGKS